MAGKKRVVIVGGGIAGLGVANTLVSKAGDLVDVYVITRDRYYVGGPTRPLLLTNEEEYGRIVRGYENVRNINLIVGSVVSIDPGNRVVNYSETLYGLGSRSINYDYLVISRLLRRRRFCHRLLLGGSPRAPSPQWLPPCRQGFIALRVLETQGNH